MEIKMPHISVVMPSLNVKQYIDECLYSVVNQTLKDIEIICIDACSSDGTREVIQNYKNIDDRITIIDSEIRSYGYQINTAVKCAKGEYIAIVETDDLIVPTMLETLYSLAKQNDLDYVKADYYEFWETKQKEKIYTGRHVFKENDILYGNVIEPKKYYQIADSDCFLWKGIYKTSFLKDYKIVLSETKGASFQDIGFLHQVMCYAKRAMYIPELLYMYRVDRDESSMRQARNLEYTYQEYNRLVEMKEWNNSEEKCLYVRMASAFCQGVYEDSKTREFSEIEKFYMWLHDQLVSAIEKDVISSQIVGENLFKSTIEMLKGEKVFQAYRKKNDIYVEYNNQIIESVKGKNVYICGCGCYGKVVYKLLEGTAANIIGFLDSDSNKWEKEMFGVKIYNPKVLTETSDVVVIIAIKDKGQEITNQLIEKKLINDAENVIDYRPCYN